MTRKKIAYVCYETEKLGAYALKEESMLLKFLQAKGLDAQPVQWHDQSIRWQEFDLIILKSPWDYHYQYSAFMAWLTEVNRLGVQVLNPYAIVQWNSDKHYLQEMISEGFNVIPSVFLPQGEQHDLRTLFNHFQTDQLIVKPCISAGSKQTITVTKESIDQQRMAIDDMTRDESFMVQPFLPQIYEGELSYLFFSRCLQSLYIEKTEGRRLSRAAGFWRNNAFTETRRE